MSRHLEEAQALCLGSWAGSMFGLGEPSQEEPPSLVKQGSKQLPGLDAGHTQ